MAAGETGEYMNPQWGAYLNLVEEEKSWVRHRTHFLLMHAAYQDKKSSVGSMSDFTGNGPGGTTKFRTFSLWYYSWSMAPQHLKSFLFPGRACLCGSARRLWSLQLIQLNIRNKFHLLLLVLADTVAMAKLTGSVGHHSRKGCRLLSIT